MKKQKRIKRIISLATAAVIIICVILVSISAPETGKQIKTISDVNGKSIVIQSGTVFSSAIRSDSRLTDSEIYCEQSVTDCLAFLLMKKADAYVTDNIIAQQLIRSNEGVCILDEALNEASYGIAFKKYSPLREMFDSAIASMKEDGTIDAMAEKWFGGDNGVKTVPEQDWEGKNGTLTCAVNLDYEPVAYIDDSGYTVGFDIDLVLGIARRLDFKIEFIQKQFSSVISDTSYGMSDFACGGITVTDERLGMLDFSDPYMSAGAVFLVRNEAVQTGEGRLLILKNSLRRTFIDEGRWKLLIRGAGVTLWITAASFFLSLVLGFLMYMWDYSGSRIAHFVLSKFTHLMALMPCSTWLLLIFYVVFAKISVSPVNAAIVGFGIKCSSDIYGALCNSVGSVSKGELDAAYSMGYSRYSALFRLFIPQGMPKFLGALQSIIIDLVKNTSIAEFIAVQDFQMVADTIRAETLDAFVCIAVTALFYIILGHLLSSLIGKIKISTVSKQRTPEDIRERLLRGKLR